MSAEHESAVELNQVDVDELDVDELDVDEVRGDADDADVLVLDEVPDPDSVLPVWEPTGNPTVDSALEQLRELDGAEVAEHSATYEAIERSLRTTLNELASDDESV